MSTESPALGPPVPAFAAGTTAEYANRGWILAVMCLALVMVVAGVSMLANALPSIAADLDASQSSQQWIVDAYALTLAALLLPAGAVGDRFGRRGALIAGTAIFGVAAGLSALAGSPDELIALRAFMGIGAALLMPGTLSTITSVFPPEERAKAVGIWAGFAGAGGTLGILASGALLEQFAWGSVFVLTAALAAVACVGMILVVPSTRAEERVAFDIRGSIAVGRRHRPPRARHHRRPRPRVDRSGHADRPRRRRGVPGHVRRGSSSGPTSRSSTRGCSATAASPPARRRSSSSSSPCSASSSCRCSSCSSCSGTARLEAALALLPMSIVILPIAAVAGTMSEKYGHRLVGGAGLAISGVGFALFATLGTGSGFWPFVLVTIVIGAGAALAMTPATNAIVASLPRAKQGVASAVNDTARELGAAFGVAVLGSAFNIGYRHDIDADLSRFPAGVAHQAREAPAIAVALSRQIPGGEALAAAAREAFTTGMRYAVLVGAGLLVVGALFVWFRGASRVEEVVEDDLDAVEMAAA